MFAFQDSAGAVEIAFTDRHRGVGGGPSASLDLAVRAPQGSSNREVLRQALAGPSTVVAMSQVHGAEVRVVDRAFLDDSSASSGSGSSGLAEEPRCDALVTRLPGVALLVRAADCVPLLLADVDAGVVAAVHAGRPGLVAGVVPEALRVMREQGASSVRAWLGPHVCGACYEVPAAMREEVAALVPESRSETSWGTPALDIGAGVRAQLRAGDPHHPDGVEVVDVIDLVDSGRCTVEDDDLFSYRRQGTDSGRLGGLVWIRS